MKCPTHLKSGDKVAIIAPAGKLVKGTLEVALNTLMNWGLQVVMGEYVEKGHHYFSGTDEERLSDFQKVLDNPEVKAIFCARGGYGTTRIIDKLNFAGFQKDPKWIVGYSDVTALHFHVHKMGVASLHSLMPTGFADAAVQSIESLKKVLFGDELSYIFDPHPNNRFGSSTGQIIGGNLSLIVDSIGTPSEIDFENKILFIEEIDEYLYKIDRMMVQLKRAGKLGNLAGFVVGHMTGMKDTKVAFGKSVEELLLDHVSEYDYPVVLGVPVGHEALNLAIPCSYECFLNSKGQEVELVFQA